MRRLLVCGTIAALAFGGGAERRGIAGGGDPSWDEKIRPLFVRTCAECHMRDGEAGLDLASSAAWTRRRADVRRCVVEDKVMPPSGRAFSDADREIVRAWLDGNR
jgi:mono/diheme cytochrome c family protein